MRRRTLVHTLGLAAFAAFAIGGALYLLNVVGVHVRPGVKTYDVRAQVPDAIALAAHADVRQAGVKIGQITSIHSAEGGPILTLELDSDHAPVYRDATLLVRAKSIAEENYVDLDPGTPRAGAVPQGGMLTADHTLEATQHDEIFSIFRKLRRRDVQRIVRGVGRGLSGDGAKQLNGTLEGLSAVAEQGQPVTAVLAAEREHVAGLVDSFGAVTRALSQRQADLQTFTRQARAAALAVDARNAKLRASLQRLPGFLAQARTTAARLQRFSAKATPVVGDLATATQDLVPAVTDLEPAAASGREAVVQLNRFAGAIRPATRQLTPFSQRATAFVPALASFLRQVNPMVGYLDPYFKELGQFFANTGAATEVKDPIGHVGRIILPISRDDLPSVLTPEQEAQLKRLLGPLDARGTNPYPKPGAAGNPASGSVGFTQLQPDPPYVKKGAR